MNFGQHDYNTRANEFLPFLKNAEFQEEVHEVMISRAPLLEFFEKSGQVQQFGNKAIFYGTEPLAGAHWKKDEAKFRKIGINDEDTDEPDDDDPTIFHQEVPIVIKKRYRSRSNYNEEKLAMEPRLLPQLLKQVVKDITTRASYELNTKVVHLLCKDTNFKNNGETERKTFTYQIKNPDGTTEIKNEERVIISNLTKKPLEEFMKPEQVWRWINNTREYMLHASTSYNKGWEAKSETGASTWRPVMNASLEEDIALIIDLGMYNMLEESIMAGRYHYNLDILDQRFARVIKTPLVNEYKFLVIDRNAFVIRYLVQEGIYEEFNKKTMNTDYYYHLWVIAGVIFYNNVAAWKTVPATPGA
jgi:hypothetical protein